MFVIDASFKTYNNIDRSINAGVYTIGMVTIQSSHKDINALNLTQDTRNRDSNAIYLRVII